MAEGGMSAGGNSPGGRNSVGIKLHNVDMVQIKTLLECPVCYEVLLPPITLCRSGHGVCNTCKANLEKCPVCRSDFSDVRDLFAEFFVRNCSISCKFREFGCEIRRLGGELAEHHLVCDFRPIKCHCCGRQVEYDLFLEHLSMLDNLKPHVTPECRGDYEIDEGMDLDRPGGSYIWEPIWLRTFETDFFCFLQCRQGSFWVWVGAYASQEECEKFTCCIAVENKVTRTELKYEGVVHQIRTGSTEAFAKGQCLIFLECQLNSLRNGDTLSVLLAIKRNGKKDEWGCEVDEDDLSGITATDDNRRLQPRRQ